MTDLSVATRVAHLNNAPPIDPILFAAKLNEGFQALRKVLIGMDPQLRQAMFALGAREHVLWKAGPGVAKSMAAELITGLFTGADTLNLQITKDMKKEAVFGHLIAKELIEQGREVRNLDGGIIDVMFAYLDEFFDGSPYLLRSLLRAINEREYVSKDGGVVKSPLHTVFATTNFHGQSEALEAVVDRFLAIAVIPAADTLADDLMIADGYLRTAGKEIELPELRYVDLLAFSEWIESPDGVTISEGHRTLHYMLMREFMQRRYEMELQKWAERNDVDLDDEHNARNVPTIRQLGLFITPRRAVKTFDYVKVAAAFDERNYVQPSDLRAAGLSYCTIGADNGHEELWADTCDELLNGISEDDIKLLNAIGELTKYVGTLLAERGQVDNLTFYVGGQAFVATRRSVAGVRASAFGGLRRVHPVVKRALDRLDDSINELTQPVCSTGLIVKGWA